MAFGLWSSAPSGGKGVLSIIGQGWDEIARCLRSHDSMKCRLLWRLAALRACMLVSGGVFVSGRLVSEYR